MAMSLVELIQGYGYWAVAAGPFLEGETMLLVHGSISRAAAPAFQERMQRVAQDFAQQHLADQKLRPEDRAGFTLLLAARRWEFEALAALRR